jgi:hypothetical protein
MSSTTLVIAAALAARVYAVTLPSTPDGVELVWSDDFSGTNANPDNWVSFAGNVSNNEVETYYANHCSLTGSGSLLITPTKVNDK